jgi:uncharacterized protein YecA (UPF0149 family)
MDVSPLDKIVYSPLSCPISSLNHPHQQQIVAFCLFSLHSLACMQRKWYDIQRLTCPRAALPLHWLFAKLGGQQACFSERQRVSAHETLPFVDTT